ncbi:MAG TPA: T9SS type A sorting domain-containing protein, partial [Ignavibacteriaceae bacterium]|nr:T9SS type A sorting domain-containing protein [Ignavibacteriaceae bacterium]
NNFNLEQNYPNPFNPSTTIKYSVAERSNVNIKVYDMLGKEVASLVNTVKEAGSYEVNFNASNLASGMYVYTITAGNFTSSKKMMLMK